MVSFLRIAQTQSSDTVPFASGRETQQTSVLSNRDTLTLNGTQSTRKGKIRGANLPQEYELAQAIQDIDSHVPQPSWKTITPACLWKGVICDDRETVYKIQWCYFDLSGSMRWNRLPRTLKSLDLSANKLTGTLPCDVLPPQLLNLCLFKNELNGELDFTHLPGTLIEIWLADNKFEGCIDLSSLPDLRTLRIQRNNLSGEVCLHSLPSTLEDLNLSGNRFTGALDLQHLPPNLKELQCDHNSFSGLVSFDRLPLSLTKLHLQECAELHGEENQNFIDDFACYGTKINIVKE